MPKQFAGSDHVIEYLGDLGFFRTEHLAHGSSAEALPPLYGAPAGDNSLSTRINITAFTQHPVDPALMRDGSMVKENRVARPGSKLPALIAFCKEYMTALALGFINEAVHGSRLWVGYRLRQRSGVCRPEAEGEQQGGHFRGKLGLLVEGEDKVGFFSSIDRRYSSTAKFLNPAMPVRR